MKIFLQLGFTLIGVPLFFGEQGRPCKIICIGHEPVIYESILLQNKHPLIRQQQ
jgi:hypothetical protein